MSVRQLSGGKPVFARDSKFRLFWKQRYLQMFVLFGMLFLLVFHYAPMFGIYIAFKDYKVASGIPGIFTSKSVGFKYFREFFTDYNCGTLIMNTIILSLLKLVFSFPLPILLAIVLNEVKIMPIKKTVQTVSYLPYFISWVVVAGLCRIFLNTTGVFNSILQNMGLINQPISFLTDKAYFRPIAVITSCWKDTGWWTILFLASISGIDPTMYEAAVIDGAGRLQRIYYITLPAIRATITVMLILALGNLLGGGLSGSNFEQSHLLGNASNYETSEIVQTYVMKIGLSKGRFSYATAIGLCQSMISVMLVVISNFFSKKITGDGLF